MGRYGYGLVIYSALVRSHQSTSAGSFGLVRERRGKEKKTTGFKSSHQISNAGCKEIRWAEMMMSSIPSPPPACRSPQPCTMPLAPRSPNLAAPPAAPQHVQVDSPGSSSDDQPPAGPASKKRRRNSGLRLTSPLSRSLSVATGNSQCASPVARGARPPPIRAADSLDSDSKWGRSRSSVAQGLRSRRVESMTLVAPRLYVGDEVAAASPDQLAQRDVTHVLNCTDQPNPLEGHPNRPNYLQLGLTDSMADMPHIQGALHDGVAFIRQALHTSTGSVLVHCARGISRSCTLAMAYLICHKRLAAEAAFEAIRSTRRCCDPNFAYWCAIKEWERAVLPASLHMPNMARTLSGPSPRALPAPSPRASLFGPAPSPLPLDFRSSSQGKSSTQVSPHASLFGPLSRAPAAAAAAGSSHASLAATTTAAGAATATTTAAIAAGSATVSSAHPHMGGSLGGASSLAALPSPTPSSSASSHEIAISRPPSSIRGLRSPLASSHEHSISRLRASPRPHGAWPVLSGGGGGSSSSHPLFASPLGGGQGPGGQGAGGGRHARWPGLSLQLGGGARLGSPSSSPR